MTKPEVHVIFGGQAGSEAKGKTVGYYAMRKQYAAAVSNFMPNAGHTYVDDQGHATMVQSIPQAVINPQTMLMLSAGSAIDLHLLFSEIYKFNVDPVRLIIDPRAVIVLPKHHDAEKANMGYISSTQKGCGEALADKVRRAKDVVLWRDFVAAGLSPSTPVNPTPVQANAQALWDDLAKNKTSTQIENIKGIVERIITQRVDWAVNSILKGDSMNHVLVECPQGYDLDVNHGYSYPYCTSRQTTPAQSIADAGIAPQRVTRITAVIRPYPIRVGNQIENGVQVGTSGEYPSKEITWEEVAKRSGYPREEIKELTTVTKKLRRVFEPNWTELADMVTITGTTDIALNFADYISYSNKNASDVDGLSDDTIRFIVQVEAVAGVPVSTVGTGAKDSAMVDLMNPDQRAKFEARADKLSSSDIEER
jgi:adenylosuccinate synthase